MIIEVDTFLTTPATYVSCAYYMTFSEVVKEITDSTLAVISSRATNILSTFYIVNLYYAYSIVILRFDEPFMVSKGNLL
jgi:hypothetical protein